MAIYDINGNEIFIPVPAPTPTDVGAEILEQTYSTLPFDKWTQAKLDSVSSGATQTSSASTTNYCILPANRIYYKAGTVIRLISSTQHDLSYKRLDASGVFLGDMKTDGISSYTYIRGTTFAFYLPYDGYYCFNSYNTGYSSVETASANLSNFTVYGSSYISQFSSYDLWRDKHDDAMRTINHRGYTADGAKANTLPAFMDSVKHGYVYVECDLRLTSDNKVVLSHDETITGTLNGTSTTLTIANETLATLQGLTLDSGRYECNICTLAELLDFCRGANVHIYLDMKVTTESAMDIYYNLVVAHGMLRNVSWSGNPTTSAYIKEKDAKARLVNLSGSASALSALLNGQNEVVVNLANTAMSASVAKSYVDAGIVPESYYISTPTKELIETQASYGVTAMTINKLHCMQVLRE